jgi:hypothetical protein
MISEDVYAEGLQLAFNAVPIAVGIYILRSQDKSLVEALSAQDKSQKESLSALEKTLPAQDES